MTWLQIMIGFVALIGGAELLVRGASDLAVRFGLNPLVVGLTVVSFGTSAPELAVGIGSSWRGNAGLAVGNVIGSNIANVLLVLGASALVGGTLYVARDVVRRDVPLMIAASVVVFLMGVGGHISRLEGTLLTIAILVYVVWTVRDTRAERGDGNAPTGDPDGHPGVSRGPAWIDVALVGSGSVALVLGAGWLVDAASAIASELGVSELVIGLTVVAIGTSLPELATSVLAALKGERDLAVGNVVGSNLFNLLCVLGVTALVSPGGLAFDPDALTLDMPIMVAVAFACLPVFFNGYRLQRWEGGLFVAYYAAYLTFLVLDATDSGLRHPFAVVMWGFVVPLTVITFAVLALQSRGNRATREPLSR